MLVLNRKLGQTIRISSNILVKLISQRGSEINVGIEVPRQIEIHREEIYQERLKKIDR